MRLNDAEIVSPTPNNPFHAYSVKLPENLVCDHCLIQVRKKILLIKCKLFRIKLLLNF